MENKSLYKAIANFQQEVPAIIKNTKGYGYKYADLTQIFEVINPLMKKHKLGFTQLVGSYALTTIVFHTESGESMETTMEIPHAELKGMNDYQTLGSAITYCRRYQISAFLGLVSESDIDAAGEQVKSKPKIDEDRLQAAIESIERGDYSKEKLIAQFSLSPSQLKKLPK